MVDKVRTIDTKHEGLIHDIQYDYYGQYMATCSSDSTIRVYSVLKGNPGEEQQTREVASWQAHTGPVWQIAWAHPKFGHVLASCGFDKKITIWSEGQREWREVISFETEGSINALSFAPWECGLKLLACGIDGTVWYISRKPNDEWEQPYKFQAHNTAVNSVSWAPLYNGLDYLAEEYVNKYAALPRFVTGSCDKSVKVWKYDEENPNRFTEVATLQGDHNDYVRDVAWCPRAGTGEVIASCSEDGSIIFWSNSAPGESDFAKVDLKKSEGAAWRLSWSGDGKMLAVSTLGPNSENIVHIYKDNQGTWEQISKLDDN